MMTLVRRWLGLGSALLLCGACGGGGTTSTPGPDSSSTQPVVEGASGAPATSTTSSSPAVGQGVVSMGKTTAATPIAGTGPAKQVSPTAGSSPSAAQTPSQAAAGGGGSGATSPAGAAGAGDTSTMATGAAGSGAVADPVPDGTPTLFWLEFNTSHVMKSQDMKTATPLVTTGVAPDGVAVDVAGGKVYWTNMGSPLGTGGGTVQRANLDGSMVETIVPAGVGTTFKQTMLDMKNKKLYWGDREGKKLWRANLDGSMHEAIVTGHNLVEVVGVAVDADGGKVYFTDRQGGKILRANIDMPAGATADSRMDVEEVLVTPPGATPIDLEIDHTAKKLYWTDRMYGTVHVMDLEMPAGMTAMNRTDDKTIVMGLSQTIGVCLDVPNNKMYFTELGGTISSAALDGSNLQRGIISSSGATGCTVAYLPK